MLSSVAPARRAARERVVKAQFLGWRSSEAFLLAGIHFLFSPALRRASASALTQVCRLSPTPDMPSQRVVTAMCQKLHREQTATPRLFDHLVGAGEQRRWKLEAERFGGAQINQKLELGRLFH